MLPESSNDIHQMLQYDYHGTLQTSSDIFPHVTMFYNDKYDM